MSYSTIADIAVNEALRRRMTACAAEQGKPAPVEEWVINRRWELAATPSWAAKWESYLAQGPQGDPGADPAVITDGDILAAVQPMT